MMAAGKALLAGRESVAFSRKGTSSWARSAVQWFAVLAIHVALIGLALPMSPQVSQVLGGVIQAGLIAPQAMPMTSRAEQPMRPPEPRPKTRPHSRPSSLLSAAPRSASPSATAANEKASDEKSSAEGVEQSAAGGASAGSASGAVQLIPPAFNADYLENPPPRYPPASRLRGEKGMVVLRVFVSAAGHAEHVEIKTSSGFEHLDSAAREAVANWRFVPARRGDEHVAAWVLVPVSFVMKASS